MKPPANRNGTAECRVNLFESAAKGKEEQFAPFGGGPKARRSTRSGERGAMF